MLSVGGGGATRGKPWDERGRDVAEQGRGGLPSRERRGLATRGPTSEPLNHLAHTFGHLVHERQLRKRGKLVRRLAVYHPLLTLAARLLAAR